MFLVSVLDTQPKRLVISTANSKNFINFMVRIPLCNASFVTLLLSTFTHR